MFEGGITRRGKKAKPRDTTGQKTTPPRQSFSDPIRTPQRSPSTPAPVSDLRSSGGKNYGAAKTKKYTSSTKYRRQVQKTYAEQPLDVREDIISRVKQRRAEGARGGFSAPQRVGIRRPAKGDPLEAITALHKSRMKKIGIDRDYADRQGEGPVGDYPETHTEKNRRLRFYDTPEFSDAMKLGQAAGSGQLKEVLSEDNKNRLLDYEIEAAQISQLRDFEREDHTGQMAPQPERGVDMNKVYAKASEKLVKQLAGAGVTDHKAIMDEINKLVEMRGPEPWAMAILEQLNRVNSAVAGAMDEVLSGNPLGAPKGAVEGAVNNDMYWQKILAKHGLDGTWSHVAGLVLDIAMDPTTYVTLGAAPGARLAAKGAVTSARKAGLNSADALAAAQKAEDASGATKRGLQVGFNNPALFRTAQRAGQMVKYRDAGLRGAWGATRGTTKRNFGMNRAMGSKANTRAQEAAGSVIPDVLKNRWAQGKGAHHAAKDPNESWAQFEHRKQVGLELRAVDRQSESARARYARQNGKELAKEITRQRKKEGIKKGSPEHDELGATVRQRIIDAREADEFEHLTPGERAIARRQAENAEEQVGIEVALGIREPHEVIGSRSEPMPHSIVGNRRDVNENLARAELNYKAQQARWAAAYRRGDDPDWDGPGGPDDPNRPPDDGGGDGPYSGPPQGPDEQLAREAADEARAANTPQDRDTPDWVERAEAERPMHEWSDEDLAEKMQDPRFEEEAGNEMMRRSMQEWHGQGDWAVMDEAGDLKSFHGSEASARGSAGPTDHVVKGDPPTPESAPDTVGEFLSGQKAARVDEAKLDEYEATSAELNELVSRREISKEEFIERDNAAYAKLNDAEKEAILDRSAARMTDDERWESEDAIANGPTDIDGNPRPVGYDDVNPDLNMPEGEITPEDVLGKPEPPDPSRIPDTPGQFLEKLKQADENKRTYDPNDLGSIPDAELVARYHAARDGDGPNGPDVPVSEIDAMEREISQRVFAQMSDDELAALRQALGEGDLPELTENGSEALFDEIDRRRNEVADDEAFEFGQQLEGLPDDELWAKFTEQSVTPEPPPSLGNGTRESYEEAMMDLHDQLRRGAITPEDLNRLSDEAFSKLSPEAQAEMVEAVIPDTADGLLDKLKAAQKADRADPAEFTAERWDEVADSIDRRWFDGDIEDAEYDRLMQAEFDRMPPEEQAKRTRPVPVSEEGFQHVPDEYLERVLKPGNPEMLDSHQIDLAELEWSKRNPYRPDPNTSEGMDTGIDDPNYVRQLEDEFLDAEDGYLKQEFEGRLRNAYRHAYWEDLASHKIAAQGAEDLNRLIDEEIARRNASGEKNMRGDEPEAPTSRADQPDDPEDWVLVDPDNGGIYAGGWKSEQELRDHLDELEDTAFGANAYIAQRKDVEGRTRDQDMDSGGPEGATPFREPDEIDNFLASLKDDGQRSDGGAPPPPDRPTGRGGEGDDDWRSVRRDLEEAEEFLRMAKADKRQLDEDISRHQDSVLDRYNYEQEPKGYVKRLMTAKGSIARGRGGRGVQFEREGARRSRPAAIAKQEDGYERYSDDLVRIEDARLKEFFGNVKGATFRKALADDPKTTQITSAADLEAKLDEGLIPFSLSDKKFTPANWRAGSTANEYVESLKARIEAGEVIHAVDPGVINRFSDEAARGRSQIDQGGALAASSPFAAYVNENRRGGGGLAGFDRLQGAIKIGQTVINPGYQFTNFVGDLFLGRQAGTKIGDVAEAMATEPYLRHVETYLGSNKKREIKMWRRKSEEQAGMLASNLHRGKMGYYKGLEGYKHQGPKQSRIFDGRGRASREDLAHLYVDLGGAQSTQISDVFGQLFSGEIGEEAITSANPARKAFNKGWEAIRQANQIREEVPRLATFIGALRTGMSPEEAIKHVQVHHFDYGDLTKFETEIGRRLIPFYTFMARNTARQAKSIAARPGVAASYEKTRANMSRAAGIDPDWVKSAPDWVQGIMPLTIPGAEQGGLQSFFNPKIPITDLQNIQPGKAANRLLSGLSTIPKQALEQALLIDFFTRDKVRKPYVPAPTWATAPGVKELINALPIGDIKERWDPQLKKMVPMWPWRLAHALDIVPMIATASDVFTPGKQGKLGAPGVSENLSGFVTGMREYPVNPLDFRRQQLFRILDQVEKEAAVGQNTNTNPDRKAGEPYGGRLGELQAVINALKKNIGTIGYQLGEVEPPFGTLVPKDQRPGAKPSGEKEGWLDAPEPAPGTKTVKVGDREIEIPVKTEPRGSFTKPRRKAKKQSWIQ